MTYVNRYRSGELDMTYNQLPIELFQKLKKEIPNELHVDPYLCTYYYEINKPEGPVHRRARAYRAEAGVWIAILLLIR